MTIKNQLRDILLGFGIKSMAPSASLLKKLGGMTLHRFNQILNNDSRTELSVLEVSLIQKWLSEVTGKQADTIEVLVKAEEPATASEACA